MRAQRKTLKVVKIGGKLIENEGKLKHFLADFNELNGPKILVHGGGIMANDLSKKLGIPTKMVDGRRITDAETMKVITMTYAGLINKNIVASLLGIGCNSLGLCGADGKSVISIKREISTIDYGFVGDIEAVNSSFITSLLEQQLVPVFSAISSTYEGLLLNTNADSIATEIAKALTVHYEVELFFCFEKQGVLEDVNDEDSLIETLNIQKYQSLLESGAINDGMLPKLHNCFQALEENISKIYLGDHTLLQEKSTFTKIIK